MQRLSNAFCSFKPIKRRNKLWKANNNQLIVLEGVSRAGKTTVGKKLAQEINAIFYQTPPRFCKDNRHLIKNRNVFIRFIYYFLANIISTWKIRKLLKVNSVVCDRYIYSTWAYHIACGLSPLKNISPFVIPFIFKRPDKAYYLYVYPDERERRIKASGRKLKKKDSKIFSKTQREFLKFSELTLIDTTNLNEDEVVKEIRRHLKMNF